MDRTFFLCKMFPTFETSEAKSFFILHFNLKLLRHSGKMIRSNKVKVTSSDVSILLSVLQNVKIYWKGAIKISVNYMFYM